MTFTKTKFHLRKQPKEKVLTETLKKIAWCYRSRPRKPHTQQPLHTGAPQAHRHTTITAASAASPTAPNMHSRRHSLTLHSRCPPPNPSDLLPSAPAGCQNDHENSHSFLSPPFSLPLTHNTTLSRFSLFSLPRRRRHSSAIAALPKQASRVLGFKLLGLPRWEIRV
jgi:hypothetical protein